MKQLMFSTWIPSLQKTGAKAPNTPAQDLNSIVKQVIIRLEARLDKELGEECRSECEQFANEITKQQMLEKTLIETKEKYNHLVNQLDAQSEAIKQMLRSIVNFMNELGESLQSTEMLTPLKDFQSAFQNCNVNKVEKQLKYFSKLYDAALNDYIQKMLRKKSDQNRDEVNLYKSLNKNLQVELFRSRNDNAQLQSKMKERNCRISELTEKLSIIQKSGVDNFVKFEAKDREKSKQREEELVERIKVLEKQKSRLQKMCREGDNEVVKSVAALEVMQKNQQNIIEELTNQIRKKQVNFEHSTARACQQKIMYQQKINSLKEELEQLKQQANSLRFRSNSQANNGNSRVEEVHNLQDKLKSLEQERDCLAKRNENLINKEIMKNLFLNYEDESKQWAIRKDIKSQIHVLLGIKNKKGEALEGKRWFGIF